MKACLLMNLYDSDGAGGQSVSWTPTGQSVTYQRSHVTAAGRRPVSPSLVSVEMAT